LTLEIKITEQRPNPLLKRTEYRFEIGHSAQSTPTRESIRSELAKDLKVPKDRVIVERMRSKFGTPKTVGEALVYTSTDDAKAIEREHVLIRNRLIEKAVVTEAPATEAPAPAAATAEKRAEKPSEKAAEKTAEKDAEKPAEKPAAKHGAKPKEA
jgi:ribosomal protein S24E